MCDDNLEVSQAECDQTQEEAEAPFDVSTIDRTAIENIIIESETQENPEEVDDVIVPEKIVQKCMLHLEPNHLPINTGSDSGVEVAAGEYASSGAPEGLSCASSLISCGSGCEDSFDVLSCNNNDRLEDFKAAIAGDGTSEGGSESSSITGSGSGLGIAPKRLPGSKKRVAVTEPGKSPRPKPSTAPRPTQGKAPALATRERARSREKSVPGDKPPPPTGPKPVVPPRARPRATPDSLALICRESPPMKVKATKTSSARCRTPGASPAPPIASSTSPRASVENQLPKSSNRMTPDSKAAYDKYATLPRRRRENSPELSLLKKDKSNSSSLENSLYKANTFRRAVTRDRESPPLKSLPPYPRNKHTKIKIYHETSVQTALIGTDVENALAGVGIKEIRTDLVLVKKASKGVQVDNRNKEIERLEAKVKLLTDSNAKLQGHCDEQTQKLMAMETRLEEERADKVAAQEELQRNTQRVLSMLGGESGEGGDSLILLESQLQTSANIVFKQQEEINKLHINNRELQKELNRTVKAYRSLESHLEETEQESNELQEFLQAEKTTLQDALKESEESTLRLQREVMRSRRECRLLVRLSEQRRHEILAARAKLAVTRPAQAAPIALPTLAQRLQNLLHTLIVTYSISPDDLEDVIFHNEAYSRSGSSEACSPGSPLPTRPQPPTSLPGPTSHFHSSRFSDDENSADLLDSETEPCLMMENVLEDVAIPDTYSHNLVSSGLSIMSCPNTAPQNIMEDVPLTCPILGSSHPNENRLLRNDHKEDSFSSLHNITTFSNDDLSPAVPDEKPISESSYYPDMDTYDLLNMGYSEHDSLQNLSQAILQRQQSEAECSMSEDVLHQKDNDMYNVPNTVVDQVILVDNLVAKLLKTLKIIHTLNDAGCHLTRTPKERLNNICEEAGAPKIDEKELNKKLCNDRMNGNYSKHDKKLCNGDCNKSENWCSKNCSTNNLCSTEEQTSPRHSGASLGDAVNSPQPIDSAA